jgi:DNA-binding response OmpR family regulator
MAKILIVEDDEKLSNNLTTWLRDQRYTVESVISGRQALDMLDTYEYDAVILDLLLPELSGEDVCRLHRARGGTTPILMLTGKTSLNDKEFGLDSGADDYLTKPFEFREMVARLRALLRRPRSGNLSVLQIGDVQLDTIAHRVMKGNKEVILQPVEYALLEFLLRHPGRVFSMETLFSRVWEADAEPSYDSIYTCIRKIRRKLDDKGKPSIIRTLYGVGYRLNNDFGRQ